MVTQEAFYVDGTACERIINEIIYEFCMAKEASTIGPAMRQGMKRED